MIPSLHFRLFPILSAFCFLLVSCAYGTKHIPMDSRRTSYKDLDVGETNWEEQVSRMEWVSNQFDKYFKTKDAGVYIGIISREKLDSEDFSDIRFSFLETLSEQNKEVVLSNGLSLLFDIHSNKSEPQKWNIVYKLLQNGTALISGEEYGVSTSEDASLLCENKTYCFFIYGKRRKPVSQLEPSVLRIDHENNVTSQKVKNEIQNIEIQNFFEKKPAGIYFGYIETNEVLNDLSLRDGIRYLHFPSPFEQRIEVCFGSEEIYTLEISKGERGILLANQKLTKGGSILFEVKNEAIRLGNDTFDKKRNANFSRDENGIRFMIEKNY